ncbi:MAG: SdiA-regulated domain-containing protein, partial [Campylobacterota bacterium]|nr:SdiA-regulated domain-containing protein [Campylobacterota bacterium]
MSLKSILFTPLALSIFACSNSTSHTIASIPEASGISYCQNTQTLVVANDEGAYYELTPKGKILTTYNLGDYDLEGVVCHDEYYIFAVEDGSLLQVNKHTQNIKKFKIKGKKVSFSKKSGIEGIAYRNGKYYLSIQSKKKQSKMLVVSLGENYAKVIDII